MTKRTLLLGLLICCLASCNGFKTTLPSELTLVATPAPSVTPASTPLPSPVATVVPTITFAPRPGDTGWRSLDVGLETRQIDLRLVGRLVDRLSLVRIDPADYRFEIAYDADHPKSIADWQQQTGARLVFNGGFFQVQNGRYLPAGLLVVDGQTIGSSYSGYGGMFTVSADGPALRWLVQDPYRPGEPLQFALQSFPILVKPGGLPGFPAEKEDNMIARRTVLGRDRAGRFIVLVTSSSYFTLYRLSAYLAASDLDLDIALNLDGGPSSGLALAGPQLLVPATSALPIVIAVFPR